MTYYKETVKPTDHNDLYERLKSADSTIVLNEGTDNEKCLCDINLLGEFIITSISREDFEAKGFDASSLTDADMSYIASKMADSYIENQFWCDVEYFASDFDLPSFNQTL